MVMILRSYGTGIFFGDQSPETFAGKLMGNLNMRLSFRLDDPGQRSIIARTAMMNPQQEKALITLPIGAGYLFCDEMTEPVIIQTPNSEKDLGITKDVTNDKVHAHMKPRPKAPYTECASCPACRGLCSHRIRSDASYMAESMTTIGKALAGLRSSDEKTRRQAWSDIPAYLWHGLSKDGQALALEKQIPWSDRLNGCLRVHLVRRFLLSPSCELTHEQLTVTSAAAPAPPPNEQDDTPRDMSAYDPSVFKLSESEIKTADAVVSTPIQGKTKTPTNLRALRHRSTKSPASS